MSPRELVILSLGLVIVAVVLRGLYVALRGRRGQLRLAIDKNIPRDVDLDALELAELPGGGARVVSRSFDEVNRQNNAVEAANVRASAMALGKRSPAPVAVPVLMDPVELRDLQRPAATHDTPAPSVRTEDRDDPDSVLFDYPESVQAKAHDTESPRRAGFDTMSQVAPDYDDDDEDDFDDEEEFDDFDEEEIEDDDYEEDEDSIDNDSDELDESDTDDFDDEEDDEEDEDDFDGDLEDYDSALDDIDEEDDTDFDEDLDFENDEGLDEFSMTAGERIGFGTQPSVNNPPAVERVAEVPRKEKVEETEAPARRPLLAAFTRALKPRETEPVADPVVPQTRQPQSRPVPVASQTARRARIEEKPIAPEETAIKSTPTEYVPTEPSEVVVLNVMARPGREFSGDDLLHVLITSGMKFGEMNIFHRRLAGESKGPVIFSAANILNPGVFDLNRMHEFTTLGISLFLALPTPINNLEAFGQMLDVARKICGALDGELRDDNRNLMTAQTIEHYRQRIRDYELRRLKAVGARG